MSRKRDDSPTIRCYKKYEDTGKLYEGDRITMFGVFDDNGSYNFKCRDYMTNSAPLRTSKNSPFGRKRRLNKEDIVNG